jgi:hypothetical protein
MRIGLLLDHNRLRDVPRIVAELFATARVPPERR